MVGDAKRFKRKMLYWMCAGRREKRRLGNVRHRGGTVRRRRADGLGDIFVRQAWNVSLEGAGDADWALSCPLAFVRRGTRVSDVCHGKSVLGRGVGEGLSRTPFLASLRKGRAPRADADRKAARGAVPVRRRRSLTGIDSRARDCWRLQHDAREGAHRHIGVPAFATVTPERDETPAATDAAAGRGAGYVSPRANAIRPTAGAE